MIHESITRVPPTAWVTHEMLKIKSSLGEEAVLIKCSKSNSCILYKVRELWGLHEDSRPHEPCEPWEHLSFHKEILISPIL